MSFKAYLRKATGKFLLTQVYPKARKSWSDKSTLKMRNFQNWSERLRVVVEGAYHEKRPKVQKRSD